MALDLLSVAHVLDGQVVGDAIPASTGIDSVVSLSDFNVVAHHDFATLVVVTPSPNSAVADAISRDGSHASSFAILQAAVLQGATQQDTTQQDTTQQGATQQDTTQQDITVQGSALQGAVLVISEDSADLRALLVRNGLTAILCPGVEPAALLPRLIGLIASDQAAEDRLVTQGTKVLTQAARRGGVTAVMAELASRIDGWAVLLDSQGHAITSTGAGRLHIQDATSVALNRPVRVRHPGLQLHPVGQGEDLSAYLVVASRADSMTRIRDLASHAAALLDLLLRRNDHIATERLGREVMVQHLLTKDRSAAEWLLRRWGVHEDTLTAFVLSSRSKSVDLERLVTRWFDELGLVHVMTISEGRVMGFVRDECAELIAERVSGYVGNAQHPLRCGFGTSVGLDALARSMTEAREAHAVAVTDGRSIAEYTALPTVSYVLDRLGSESSQRLAGVLDGLRDSDGSHAELTQTLQTYLSEHGSWGVTAHQLGIHRQTLNARIRRIEELTGLSMSDPDDRAAAWLAIRALKR